MSLRRLHRARVRRWENQLDRWDRELEALVEQRGGDRLARIRTINTLLRITITFRNAGKQDKMNSIDFQELDTPPEAP